ncbi:hypothetical protein I7I48_12267 [Histoplasma ohiense]|nr:hypothetical protein I7I48_12267 [Histoplasma ohiense (nom. inval.)]
MPLNCSTSLKLHPKQCRPRRFKHAAFGIGLCIQFGNQLDCPDPFSIFSASQFLHLALRIWDSSHWIHSGLY